MTTVRDLALADLPLRPELVGEEPYGAPQLDVPVPLNVNENPYPPSAATRIDMAAAILQGMTGVNRYPDREATELRTALAGYLGHGLGLDEIWAANGSNEVMTHVLGAFAGPGRTVVSFDPTDSMYPEYARNTHSAYVTVPRLPDFSLTADLIVDAVSEHEPSVVVVTTPNNPTGTSIPLSVLDEVLSVLPGETLLVVDEAYQEFARDPDQTAVKLLADHANLIVSRTMSKAFAFAGGRVGYLAAAPAIVDACRIVRLPYHLSSQTQALATVALRHADEMLAQVDLLRAERDRMLVTLPELGLEVVDSDANFVLTGRFVDRHAAFDALLEHGVLVRETGPEGYLRVSAGTKEEMDAFYTAVESVLPALQLIGKE
jgi:histidinol-phosphate aminotransferase